MSTSYKKQLRKSLTAVIVTGAALALAWGIAGTDTVAGSKSSEKATRETVAETSVPGAAEPASGKETAATAANPPAAANTATVRYPSVQKEGIVGKYGDRQTDNPADNIFTVSLDRRPAENDRAWLSYELEGVADYTGVPYAVNDRPAAGGYLVKLSGGKSLQRTEIDPARLKKGENRILFSLPEGDDYGYKVSSLSIEIEKDAGTSPLVVNSTGTGYGNKGYLHGFIRQKDTAGAKVYIDGKETPVRDGEFEAVVPVNDSRRVNIKAVSAGGKESSKEIIFTRGDTASFEYAPDNNIRRDSKTFRKGKADELRLASALLKVEAGALLSPAKSVTVSTLRPVDVPALDMGMNNVTAEYKGYRFLPHGELFADGATVIIKYDRTKIPDGFTEDDIRTYYFDLDTKHWLALERDTLDKKNQLVVSRTTHFTDMINGVIQTPESPETQGFAPTTMNGIKAADPTAKVRLIAPPTADNRGSAGLSYSFEMPPARNGMQPNPGISYNSDAGSGLLGEGWDLNTPGISVDTRWGVPRYDDATETETYLLNGGMLMTTDDNGEPSVAHRGDKIARKADRRFYLRNEGGFSKIIRKGSSPSDYTWEVTDKSGTVYTYGGNGGVLKGTAGTLNGDREVIASWKLSRVEEPHGDRIEYIYEAADEPVRGGLTAKALYLKEIRAGNKGADAHTVVTLTNNSQKDKKINSGRYGFLTSENRLLDRVDVVFEGKPLRSYTFEYKTGAFNTNVLSRINHIDSEGNVFASHDMDYYDDVKSAEGYRPFEADAETWNLPDDGIDAGFVNPVSSMGIDGFSDKASALGGSVTTSTSASFYAGVGPWNFEPVTKSGTIGGSAGYSNSTSKGLSAMIDINGDGLPDKVYQKNGSLYYRPNISRITGSGTKYGDEIEIKGIKEFSRSTSKTTTTGLNTAVGYLAATAVKGYDNSSTTSRTQVYFADVNNDGLPDLVSDGKVYFNHIEKDAAGNLVPTFTLSSGDTPSPINGGGIIDDSDTQPDPLEQAEIIAGSPLQDVVRVWEAPYSGTIGIEGNVSLQQPEAGYDETEYENADGVRVAIQVAGTEKWNKSIAKGDFASYPATVSGAAVTKGQKVYFRVQSGTSETANGAFDRVKWDPVITYTDKTNRINPDGLGTAVFNVSEADVISEDQPVRLMNPVPATVTGTFEKPVTSDNVTLKITLSNEEKLEDGSNNPSYQTQVVYTRDFAWDETYSGELTFDISNPMGGLNLKFEVVTQTNIAFEKVKWLPVVTYMIDGNETRTVANVSYTTFARQMAEGQPYDLAADGNLRVEPRFSGLTGIANTSVNGTLLMAVKNITGLIAKQTVTVTGGVVAASSIINSVAAPAGTVRVEYYVTDAALLSALGNPSALITVNAAGTTVAADMFTTRDYDGFGIINRGWGQFVYNAAEGRSGNPIDESLLKLPQSGNENITPLSMVFIPMGVDKTDQPCRIGQNENSYIKGDIISSSRLNEQNVILTNPLAGVSGGSPVTGSCIPGSGAVGVTLETKSTSKADMTGAMGVTYSDSKGESRTMLSFADMNGDGYPDIISPNRIQITNTKGGFDGETVSGISNHRSESETKGWGLGGSPVHAASSVSNTAKYFSAQSSIDNGMWGRSGTYTYKDGLRDVTKRDEALIAIQSAKNMKVTGDIPEGGDRAVETFMDVNGDGLPDKILSDKRVRLNLGYGFTDPVDWELQSIQEGENSTVNAGIGFNFGGGSISAGFGLTTTSSKENYTLTDLNGDGLPDKVWKDGSAVKAAFNTGNGFTTEIVWQGVSDIGKSASTAESLNAAYSTNILIPIPFAPLKLSLNPGVNTGRSMSRTLTELRDIDGDGFPDIVSSDREGEMTVYRSAIARTGKLKTVYNPLGGSFTLDYARSEATYDHPSGKWVMKSVETNDGIGDDGADTKVIFDYSGGRLERHEREFLGFGKVITKSIDTESGEENKVYRQSIQQYDVNSVYTAGNPIRSAVEDAAGNKYTESVSEYYAYKVKASADNYTFTADNNFCTDRAIAFTPLKYTQSAVYEGQADGLTANESFYEYYLNGNFGELKTYTYSDRGTLGNDGTGAFNYKTSVEYTGNPAKHILGLPVKVRVEGSDGVLYRLTEAVYDLNYADHLTQVTQTLNGTGEKAVTDIEYDKYGNITKKTLPADGKGQRMWYRYLYDRDYNMYPERVEDALGYRSETEDYDYRYGIPLTVRDMNGYTTETTIDRLGRIETVTGPNEQVLGLPYTVRFEYHPQATKSGGEITSPAYAVTKHYDPQNPGDDMETVTFADGFGRAVQVKKDGAVYENGTDDKVMLVSGRAKFDPFGRVKEAFYPVTEPAGNKTVFNPAFDNITPTETVYDVLDRVVKTTLPDGSGSLTEYTKDNGSRTLITTVTDAAGGKQSTFTNGSGLTVKTEQYSGPEGTITTRFEFDPINQLLKAVDNGNNETVSAYDMAGRRTQVIHPVSGKTSFKYDNAGNLISKQTANLEAEGKFITYEYDYKRLTAINYPDNPQNNVKYYYGNKNASYNRVGRLMLQEDATGAQEFFYDRLGNVNKVRRTVVIPNQAVATYVTEWAYDSWNRIEQMIYPDLEKVSYTYNTGGLLESVKGEKAYSYNYVNRLGYDKFEQRVYMKYCNGSETTYNYDPQRRRLSNLTVTSGKDVRKEIMNNAYTYDAVDNVLSVVNTAPLPNTGMGGQMAHTYNYDGLYRLISATGTYAGANAKSASYSLEMAYDNLHNIVSKKQHVQQQGVQFDGVLKAGYDLTYNYANNPFQISTLKDENYRTEGDADKDKITNEHKYEYDANGNLIYVNTAREKQDGTNVAGSGEKKLVWDEENRLQSVYTNGFTSGYWYDASGERVVKTSGDDEGVYVNDIFSGARTSTDNFTAYVSPYMVVSKGGSYTKHIYIGNQRIVSKLGDLDSYGQDPRRIEYAGSNVDGASVNYKGKYTASQQAIRNNYAVFEVPYYGTDNDNYVDGKGFCCNDASQLRSGAIGNGNDNPEVFQYYYHSDHLESSSLITNLDGDVVQHVEYVPFGEVFIEERNNTWNTPYLFNAKELDEETGLYYYGARYYDPKTSVWLGTDPKQEKYPNISTYSYCANNPVRFIDSNGMEIDLSGMSEDERKRYELQVSDQRQNSKLFNTMYSSLESSKDVYVVEFGQTVLEGSDQIKGQFLPNKDGGGTITFLSSEASIAGAVLSEELFHAYQHDNRGHYDNGEFNLEFEAKVFVTAVGLDYGGFGYFPGMENFQLKMIVGTYGNETQIISPETIVSQSFVNNYTNSANSYAEYNRVNHHGNSNYKKNTTVSPYSLQKVIIDTYKEK